MVDVSGRRESTKFLPPIRKIGEDRGSRAASPSGNRYQDQPERPNMLVYYLITHIHMQLQHQIAGIDRCHTLEQAEISHEDDGV